MTGFHQALTGLLSALDIPVYPAGQIPGNTRFPYITCQVGAAAFGGTAPVIVSAWFLGSRARSDRADICERIRLLIPEEGVRLRFDGGMAVCYRASGEFISLVTDATEPRTLGARIRLTVKLYDL